MEAIDPLAGMQKNFEPWCMPMPMPCRGSNNLAFSMLPGSKLHTPQPMAHPSPQAQAQRTDAAPKKEMDSSPFRSLLSARRAPSFSPASIASVSPGRFTSYQYSFLPFEPGCSRLLIDDYITHSFSQDKTYTITTKATSQLPPQDRVCITTH